ncbi:hypothetical protein EXIGLDRAFT_343351 [Exidia glandulosa HHB12029]|uniref:Uncharacterized protein n=1 Tax=Exidia glandulosa HHB12029 TaxID=1314781 RepID=A0A165LI01_EXIGL|nr:hypothetical protein EXIGLDRAFT_343351 [Exidia glandulosa HHB12029]
MTVVKRQPTQRQNSLVRAVNSLMPAVKLSAEDVMPDSLAAKAIGDMTKELETSVATFGDWERQLGRYAGPTEWDQVVQGVHGLQEDAEAALTACRQMRINQRQFASAMTRMLQRSQYSTTQRLQDSSDEIMRVGEDIAGQSAALQQHVAAMRDRANQLEKDIASARVAGRAVQARSWKQNLATTVKAIFRACGVLLTALAAVLPAIPSIGAPAAILAGAGGAISGGIADGAAQIERYYNKTLKKEILLTTTAQEVKMVISKLGGFPAYQRVLEAEMALQAGRVVRMRSGGELRRATEMWRAHMLELE